MKDDNETALTIFVWLGVIAWLGVLLMGAVYNRQTLTERIAIQEAAIEAVTQ